MRDFLEEMTREAGGIVRGFFGKKFAFASKEYHRDFVTDADIAANNFIVQKIKATYPDHGIISEESPAEHPDAEYVWIVDPLDGTKNFSNGLPVFAVEIALTRNKEIILSAIYQPITDCLYMAERGKGAYKNGERLHCSEHADIPMSQGCFSMRFIPERAKFLEFVLAEAKNTQKPFWMGNFYSSAINGTLVAEGHYEWLVSKGAKVWDNAPIVLLLEEAGCTVTNEFGKPWSLTDDSIVAANPVLHQKIINSLCI